MEITVSNIDPNVYVPQNILDAYWFANNSSSNVPSQPLYDTYLRTMQDGLNVGRLVDQVVQDQMRHGNSFVISEPEFVGAFPPRVDVPIVPREIPTELRFIDVPIANRPLNPLDSSTWYNHDGTTPKEPLEPEQPKIPPRFITNAIMELEV